MEFLEGAAKDSHILCSRTTNQLHLSCGLKALEDLLRRPWWSRTWTLQEIVLAHDATIICGALSLSWKDLVGAYANMRKHMFKCCQVCKDCLLTYQFSVEVIGTLFGQRELLKLSKIDNFVFVLAQHRSRQATDPRDKVYGLLGLAHSPQSSQIVPNYSSSVEDIYVETIVNDIKCSGSLRSLSFAVDNESSRNIPSWVTDWTSCSKYRLLAVGRQKRHELYNASNGRKCLAKLHGNWILSTAAVRVDYVIAVSDVCQWENAVSLHTTLKQWRALSMLDREPGQVYIDGGLAENAFWRTVIVDATVLMNIDLLDLKFIRAVLVTVKCVHGGNGSAESQMVKEYLML